MYYMFFAQFLKDRYVNFLWGITSIHCCIKMVKNSAFLESRLVDRSEHDDSKSVKFKVQAYPTEVVICFCRRPPYFQWKK